MNGKRLVVKALTYKLGVLVFLTSHDVVTYLIICSTSLMSVPS